MTDLPPTEEADHGPRTERKLDLRAALAQVRRVYADEALRRSNGNKAEAARLLGMSRRSFYNLLDDADESC